MVLSVLPEEKGEEKIELKTFAEVIELCRVSFRDCVSSPFLNEAAIGTKPSSVAVKSMPEINNDITCTPAI
jgi:hypothetical protein